MTEDQAVGNVMAAAAGIEDDAAVERATQLLWAQAKVEALKDRHDSGCDYLDVGDRPCDCYHGRDFAAAMKRVQELSK